MTLAERKLNMKRVRDTLIWTLLIGGILTLLYFSVQRKSQAQIASLVVHIDDIYGQDQLITESDVIRIVEKEAGRNLTHTDIRQLDIRRLEVRLNEDKRIERADLYFDSNDRLNVRVIQKKPIMRVIDNAGAEYYLDNKGFKIPVSLGHGVRVPVVTGLNEPFHPEFLTQETPSKLKEVFEVLAYIAGDDFLSSLIEQVHVDNSPEKDMILIPKIGREKIIFGNSEMLEDKFFNLKIFYKDGMTKLGWSRYKTLNLKYSGQVRGVLSNPELAEMPFRSKLDSLPSF
jgi:cell division protein FtsQ